MAKKIHMPLSNKNRRRRRILAEIAIFKFSRIEDELCVMLKRVPWTRAIYYNIPLYSQIRSLWRADGSLGTSLWSFLTKLLVYYTHTAFNKKNIYMWGQCIKKLPRWVAQGLWFFCWWLWLDNCWITAAAMSLVDFL